MPEKRFELGELGELVANLAKMAKAVGITEGGA
jgi:hypothetical protein